MSRSNSGIEACVWRCPVGDQGPLYPHWFELFQAVDRPGQKGAGGHK